MNEGPGWVSENILEYKPLIYFYRDLHYHWILYYWVMLGILAALLLVKYIVRKKFDPAEFLAVSFINAFANFYSRGLMFALILSAFFMGKGLHELWESRERLKPKIPLKAIVAAVLAALIVTGFLYIWEIQGSVGWALRPYVTGEWVSPWYPRGAVQFMKENRIQPPMYNDYTWGGFLIFSAYPDYKVFADGRALDEEVSALADAILKAQSGWKQDLDAYGINFILIPPVYKESGYIVPLSIALAEEPEWELVYLRNNSALYVKNIPQNGEIIRKHRVDKKNVFLHIIKLEDMLLESRPGNPIYRKSREEALSLLSKP